MKNLFKTEDWWSVWIGLFVFVISLFTLFGVDLLGWGVKTNEWIHLSQATGVVSKAYAGMPGIVGLILTYVFMLIITCVGAKGLGLNLGKFAGGFTLIFWISYLCWLLGHWAPISVNTPAGLKKFGISFSLKLTGESGFIIALLVGLIIGNFFKGFAGYLKEATRPEWYIKTAIVILGAGLGVKAAGSTGLATAVMFRGLCAIVEAYLIYWALVYLVSRKVFKFNREWAAVLASGISICGVSAAIATGGAIRARPVVPVMVASLVVIFAVVELVILPGLADEVLDQPAHGGRGLDGVGGQDRRRSSGERGHHRGLDPRQRRSCRGPLAGRLDPDGRYHHEDFHRHVHRHMGLYPGHRLDHGHRSQAG